MKIKELIDELRELQKRYPDANIYFTDGKPREWFETYFQAFNVDEENNNIEMLFDTEEEAMESNEDEEPLIRYYVCGIGYDELDRITDHEQSFGDFDTYEEAYELFVRLQCRNAESFFENAPDLYQLVVEIEECEEYDDATECVDVRNEWRIVNPKF